jgi:hypothetical protein
VVAGRVCWAAGAEGLEASVGRVGAERPAEGLWRGILNMCVVGWWVEERVKFEGIVGVVGGKCSSARRVVLGAVGMDFSRWKMLAARLLALLGHEAGFGGQSGGEKFVLGRREGPSCPWGKTPVRATAPRCCAFPR